jgi:HK97 family phage major capsid protein
MKTAAELRQIRAEKLEEANQIIALAESEDRDFTDAENESFEALKDEAESLLRRAERQEQKAQWESNMGQIIQDRQAPHTSKTGLGDTEEKALAHYVRTGDAGGLAEMRASNDTTMNITTDADGGYAVPTGHHNEIIAKKDEISLVSKLNVRQIPGKGTTVNIPVDNEDDGEFVSTAESNAYDRDAPALTVVQSTLVKYTKKVDLTVELLEDEDSKLLAFLSDFIGRGRAKTENSLLLTEVGTNGTALKTFASATVIAVDELEPIVYNDALSSYLDDGGSVGWVMRSSVHGEIALLDDANTKRYAVNTLGDGKSLLGFPVTWSAKSGATAASTNSVYFGNWNYVGVRFGPGMTMIRDPYTRGGYGEVLLYYMFRADFNVLQAEAIGYGVHPSA